MPGGGWPAGGDPGLSLTPELERWLRRDPARIRALMPLWGWFHHHYFRVQSSGWENIPAHDPVLFVGSHNGGLAAPDMHMLLYEWFRRFGFARQVHGLAHARIWQVAPWLAEQAAAVGAIPADARLALAVLESGRSLLVYPGGGQDAFRPHRLRGRIHFAGRSGYLRLAIRCGVPLVPVISWGAHDSLWVIEDLHPLLKRLHACGMPWPMGFDPEVMPLYVGLPWGLALGPLPNLPWPVRIHIRICAPIHLERHGVEAARDRTYVRACQALVTSTMQDCLDRLRWEVETSRPSGARGVAAEWRGIR